MTQAGRRSYAREIGLVIVPYDGAHYKARMGRGPLALLGPMRRALEESGHRVFARVIETQIAFGLDAAVMFDLARSISLAVAAVRASGAFPIVLSGNCASSLGTVTALGPDTAVIWCDAHGDLHTPETTESGFLDGTALATLTGRCWRTLSGTIPGWTPIQEENVVLVGARDLDQSEVELLGSSAITRVAADAPIDEALRRQASRSNIYLHIDLDVFDVSVGRANQYSSAGGMTAGVMRRHVEQIAATGRLGAVSFTAYDPSCDDSAGIANTAVEITRWVSERALTG